MNQLTPLPRSQGLFFEDALRLLRMGHAVRRREWDPGIYLYLELPFSSWGRKLVLLDKVKNNRVPWARSDHDLFADDWEEAYRS